MSTSPSSTARAWASADFPAAVGPTRTRGFARSGAVGGSTAPERTGGPALLSPRSGPGRARLAAVEALDEVAAERPQGVELHGTLDALGDHGEVERVGEVDHAADHGAVAGRRTEAGHERPVELQDVDRQAVELAQRRVP